MEKNELAPIKNFLDALEIGKIRNQGRPFMTNDTSYKDPFTQLFWYFNIYRNKNKDGQMTCFLFKNNNNNSGFGLVKKSSGKYWITGGLKSTERGKGLGKVLFKQLVHAVPSEDVWLEVLDTNIIAKKIYQKLGFKEIEKKRINQKKVTVMKLTKGENDKI